MYFARVLRNAGIPIGPGKVMDALRAVIAVGVANREDFYWTLHAVFVDRHDRHDLFDQAFRIFWRGPRISERLQPVRQPAIGGDGEKGTGETIARRIAEALKIAGAATETKEVSPDEEIQLDAAMTWSRTEVLRNKDFEKMTAHEIEAARKEIAKMRLAIADVPTRRYRANPAGARADMRATLRAALRFGGDFIPLKKRSIRRRPPPLVAICDISGSMERYSRMLIHFLHAMTGVRGRVDTFLFGTRLTNVTRWLRYKDVDVAFAKLGAAVEDWSGGTRIGRCVGEFNRKWSRRVLGQGAIVLLITDGLDRDAGAGLNKEMERLHKSCRRLIWLNPLLRYDQFEPKSVGIRAIMPHVDEFRSAHNLDSLSDVVAALNEKEAGRYKDMAKWRELAQ
ncbi:MAG: VWA domain-containing protein [Proteobacteria bacterium]|nr:VWA domain-containing protein [Pseudomonadota bacterium]MCH8098695.1 VWA domain-containing protein [Pseudomonadota bacterium]